MSMDLYVWKRPLVTDEDEATRLIELDDESVFEPSADLERFYAELLERFPPPESFTDVELETAEIPWADSPEGSDRLVWLSIRWSAKGEHLDAIVELAREYDLVLYDPQGPSFHSPADPGDDEPYVPTLGEYARGALLTCIGVLLMVVAWKASIPVLSWIVIFVGGFVTLVAVFSLGAVAHQTWVTRAIRSR
jgi:hypothetical protein